MCLRTGRETGAVQQDGEGGWCLRTSVRSLRIEPYHTTAGAVGAHVFQSSASSAQSSEVTSFLYAQPPLLA